MNFQFTPEQQMIRKIARDFADEVIAPRVNEMEATCKPPEGIYKEMGDAGILGVLIPEEYGGCGLGTLASQLCVEEFSRVSAALGCQLQVFYLSDYCVINFGAPEVKQKYLPGMASGRYLGTGAITESTGGSDPSAMTTVAVRDGDDWVINGRKCFLTNNVTADVLWVTAKTSDNPKRFTSFWVDKNTMPGIKVGRIENKIGFKGCDEGDLIFQNCRVPDSNVLWGEGRGIAVAMAVIGRAGRIGMTGVALGITKAALDASVKFAKERVLYGKPIANLQAIQLKVAEISTLLETSRLLAYRAAWSVDNRSVRNTDVSMAKAYSVDAAVRASCLGMELMGGYGVLREYRVERCLRDAQMVAAAAGTSDMQRLTVAREVLGTK